MSERYEIGMVGLGVMGRNLLLNIAEHGYSVAGYDRDPTRVQLLQEEKKGPEIRGAGNPAELAGLLRTPRAIIILVPAGPPVDAVIHDMLPHLQPGDLLIDGGNSYFRDTDLRSKTLAAKGFSYLGVGISGGEYGARHGPSMMVGGPPEAYERVRPIFESIAARADGQPCVAYLGPRSAGHYVKMVHNGIEYGLLQLIAETYDLMKRGLGMSDDELHGVYDRWNQGELNSYLVEITARIFLQRDDKTGKRLVDVILDVARQMGTGMWTLQDAVELKVPVPTISSAVTMRDISTLVPERDAANRLLGGSTDSFQGKKEELVNQLQEALYAGMILTFAQGMAQLQDASKVYGYHLPLAEVARIWRGGCIIRAALVELIYQAFRAQPDLANLLLDARLGKEVEDRQSSLRTVCCTAAQLGLPAPALMASLAYFDAYRSAWLPTNLIQAQRDYFGAHTYERVDSKGAFHTAWEKVQGEG